jgi:hypothetical protein
MENLVERITFGERTSAFPKYFDWRLSESGDDLFSWVRHYGGD